MGGSTKNRPSGIYSTKLVKYLTDKMVNSKKKKTQNLDGVIPSHWMSGLADDSKSGTRLSPTERVKIIERAYSEVLGRDPDTRDLSFYKYSSATEETIRAELLESDEHKALISDGRELKKVKNLLENAKSKIRTLESEISAQQESFKELQNLLKEKNLHIEKLKKDIENPFVEN